MNTESGSSKSGLLVGKNKEFLYNYSAINAQLQDEIVDDSILTKVKTCFSELMLLPVVCLVSATAMERITFKITVDRMLPYQFILVEIIFFLSSVLFGLRTAYKSRYTQEITEQMRQFPHSKILLMAVLDTFQFIMLVFSAAEVSPTMSVLLMHASTLFIVIGSSYSFPNRKYSRSHKLGVLLMSVALFVCLFKITANHVLYATPLIETVCGYIYVTAAALQGLSTLYKERSITEWSQPIDIYYLSSWLFFYQFLITFLLSFVYYTVRVMVGEKLKANPFVNIYNGVECFLGSNPDPTVQDNNCSESLWIICGFVLSNFLVLYFLGKVLQLSNQIVGRAMAAAIFVAFIVLWVYDIVINHVSGSFVLSSNVGLCDITAVVILLVGMEIYGRDPEPDEELITNYYPPNGVIAKAPDAINQSPASFTDSIKASFGSNFNSNVSLNTMNNNNNNNNSSNMNSNGGSSNDSNGTTVSSNIPIKGNGKV